MAVSFKTNFILFFVKFLRVTGAYGGHSIEVGREVVLVAGGISVFFLFCGSQSKSLSSANDDFFFILGSAFEQLYLLLYEPQNKKPTNISPATQATREGTRDLLIFGPFSLLLRCLWLPVQSLLPLLLSLVFY